MDKFKLTSCAQNEIQPVIASALTDKEAWDRLTSSFASKSRSRIISLKSKLAKNPKGNRSVAVFLNEMRSIADELALVQSPIHVEDLLVHILTQLGEEYNSITVALKVREQPISYPELFDKLVDFEQSLKEVEPVAPQIVTANASQRQPGHDTRDCRKLAKFLKDHHITFNNNPTAPVANVVSFTSHQSPQQWMMDSGASHHLTSCPSTLSSVSEYGGPDEVELSDGTNLSISHTGGPLIFTLRQNH
ncbi:putative RNA-directed DNA polymerase [Tanacetum coccineum]